MQISKSVEDNAWWPQAKQGSLDMSFPAPLPGEIYNLSLYKNVDAGTWVAIFKEIQEVNVAAAVSSSLLATGEQQQ